MAGSEENRWSPGIISSSSVNFIVTSVEFLFFSLFHYGTVDWNMLQHMVRGCSSRAKRDDLGNVETGFFAGAQALILTKSVQVRPRSRTHPIRDWSSGRGRELMPNKGRKHLRWFGLAAPEKQFYRLYIRWAHRSKTRLYRRLAEDAILGLDRKYLWRVRLPIVGGRGRCLRRAELSSAMCALFGDHVGVRGEAGVGSDGVH